MKHRAALLVCCLILSACEREERENVYEPGGRYAKLLDARGKRHIIRNSDGTTISKIRVRPGTIKVYDSEMSPLGELDTAGPTLRVTRRGAEPVEFEPAGVAYELPGRLRIEPVEHGWAVFDGDASRLGYFRWLDDGRLALRDDYSSEPRVFARIGDSEARTPAGKVEFTVEPMYSAAVLLPFAVQDSNLDALDLVALGVWLTREKTRQVLEASDEP